MKKRIKKPLFTGFILCILMCLFSSCVYISEPVQDDGKPIYDTESVTQSVTEKDGEPQSVTETEYAETSAATEPVPRTETEPAETSVSMEKDGSYTTPEDVAEYIHTFGTLPPNFITKKEAQALGWDSGKGNLWDAAPDKSIGGDRFGNYEKLLPVAEGRKYTECDVNYNGGYRGGERIIFSNDGLIFYTDDHYKTFTQLY